jgi:hypothetical protein
MLRKDYFKHYTHTNLEEIILRTSSDYSRFFSSRELFGSSLMEVNWETDSYRNMGK